MSLKAIVTDIEGTTSSIHFVHQVLFPFARAALPGFVGQHRDDPAVRPWLQQVADEVGCAIDAPQVVETLLHWIDIDRKHTALKALQGMIWESGYAGGDFLAHVYPDVPDQLRAWHEAGLRLFVYSSGSIAAQKLFFGHSKAGNLLPLFEGHFDTTIGGKREVESYRRILGEIGLDGGEVLFLSDIVAELDAARAAGIHTRLLEREGEVAERNGHVAVPDFRAIDLPG
ncbi:acireductone synthase [Pseudofulvimonas gallinarii]|uniref:Enolase-phosphatase E1 n=1 Tax=Pseudofulvimonas gallinarii TaxID=634155 RepID=A0A4R3LDX5_9GAMM|nr:acireductone synthase [Pseudofulvimonas gallinarii]TCS97575.1 acireductone synthase [Pseudofulvimonas gallinarii]THD13445.1 acireductone synthase [Pseudofulvimonas gallinarii]